MEWLEFLVGAAGGYSGAALFAKKFTMVSPIIRAMPELLELLEAPGWEYYFSDTDESRGIMHRQMGICLAYKVVRPKHGKLFTFDDGDTFLKTIAEERRGFVRDIADGQRSRMAREKANAAHLNLLLSGGE